jgi:hypothetical protein
VWEASSVNGPTYSDDDAIGVVPSVVYRIAAPAIAESVTVTDDAYDPASGPIVGAAAVPKFI